MDVQDRGPLANIPFIVDHIRLFIAPSERFKNMEDEAENDTHQGRQNHSLETGTTDADGDLRYPDHKDDSGQLKLRDLE